MTKWDLPDPALQQQRGEQSSTTTWAFTLFGNPLDLCISVKAGMGCRYMKPGTDLGTATGRQYGKLHHWPSLSVCDASLATSASIWISAAIHTGLGTGTRREKGVTSYTAPDRGSARLTHGLCMLYVAFTFFFTATVQKPYYLGF